MLQDLSPWIKSRWKVKSKFSWYLLMLHLGSSSEVFWHTTKKFEKNAHYVCKHCVKSVQIRSFFWSVFSRIRTEYGEILLISPYLVWIRENTDQKKLRVWTLFTQWWFKNMFDVNNKDTRTALASVLMYLLIILKIFKAFFWCFYN